MLADSGLKAYITRIKDRDKRFRLHHAVDNEMCYYLILALHTFMTVQMLKTGVLTVQKFFSKLFQFSFPANKVVVTL